MQIVIGVIARWLMTLFGAWLSKHGADVNAEAWQKATEQIAGLAIVFVPLLWSLWIKRHRISGKAITVNLPQTPGGLAGGKPA